MSEEWLLLFTSNTTKEYTLDFLETMGVPKNFVMHFRYRKKWVQSLLWDKLPIKGTISNDKFENQKSLILYVFQQEINKQLEWKYIYPIRFGKIKECYRTGKRDSDIAHFYFEVQEYCSIEELTSSQAILTDLLLKTSNSGSQNRYFATLNQPFNTVSPSSGSNESAFISLADAIDLEHLKSPDLQKQYYPVFYYIKGFKEVTFLKYTINTRQSYYEFTESRNYTLESSIYLKKPPHPESKVELTCHEKRFENQPHQEFALASSYDEFTWPLIPASVVRKLHTMITLRTDIKPLDDSFEALNLTLNIPLIIKFDIASRVVETFQDVSFAVATFLIAFITLADKVFKTPIPAWIGVIVAALFVLGVLLKIYLQWKDK